MQKHMINLLITTAGLSLLFIAACGPTKGTGRTRSNAPSKIEAAFAQASKDTKIPTRLLQAVAEVESRTSPVAASSRYGEHLLAPSFGETAFGLSAKELGIVDDPEKDTLPTQIAAYAKWLRHRLSTELPKDPKSTDDKFAWVSAIAREHRKTTNTRTIFSQELIQVLNEGFTWYDSIEKRSVKFAKENPAIKKDGLSSFYQKQLGLATSPSADARNTARWLHHDDKTKKPSQDPHEIEILHCPFSLSRCIELQDQIEEIGLKAHYIVPADESYVDLPLQLVFQNEAVLRTNPDGYSSFARDQIRVILAGQSGQLVNGIREKADPNWLSKWQLRATGQLVREICSSIAHLHSNSEEEFDDAFRNCAGSKVQFALQEDPSLPYNWGHIVDFDSTIFRSYIDFPSSLAAQTDLTFNHENASYRMGEEVKFKIQFDPTVVHVDLEHLVRCPNKKVMWLVISSDDVRGKNDRTISKYFWDGGPNGDGVHFVRAKVYGRGRELLGWDQKSFLLEDFKDAAENYSESVCPI